MKRKVDKAIITNLKVLIVGSILKMIENSNG